MHVPQKGMGIRHRFVGIQFLKVGMGPVYLNPHVVPFCLLDQPFVIEHSINELAHLQMIGGLKYQVNVFALRIIGHASQRIHRDRCAFLHVIFGNIVVDGHRDKWGTQFGGEIRGLGF
jgi:hypothetical protein